jgi:hypothetical protein
MNNKRWISNEKIELMKLYSEGKTYDEISKKLNRSPNAIKLRLESIVYDNLAKGKKISMLLKLLNTNIDTIKQFYYSHKSFRQGKGESVVDINFSDKEGKLDYAIKKSKSDSVPIVSHKHDDIKKHKSMSRDKLTNKNNIDINEKLERIDKENRVFESIIKNYQMRRQIKKLFRNGQLDLKTLHIYKKIIKNDISKNAK